VEKDEGEFGNDKSKKSGKRGQCKLCDKAIKSIYAENNKQRVKIVNKTNYLKHKEKYIDDRKIKTLKLFEDLNLKCIFCNNLIPLEVFKKRQVNTKYCSLKCRKLAINENRRNLDIERKNEINKLRKIAREKNRDNYLKTRKKYYDKNAQKINKYQRERDRNELLINPKLKARKRVKDLFRSGLFRKGTNKSNSFLSYTGIPYSDYITYFENNYPVEFSEITEKGKYHIDHIIPCAVYDFNNTEHIKLCWQPENLRIIPAKENLEKKDKLDFELIRKHKIEHLLPEGVKCQN